MHLYSEPWVCGQIFPASEDHTYFSILLHLYGNVPDLGMELC